MPFDVLPQETQTKTRFQMIADAMLRGCAISVQCRDGNWVARRDGVTYACAMGAVELGCGGKYPPEWEGVSDAYRSRYGCGVLIDNDCNGFTREQIAARIAAL